MKTTMVVLCAATLLSIPAGHGVAELPPVPEDVVGGAWWICPALGIVTGLQVASGQILGAITTVVAAATHGCI